MNIKTQNNPAAHADLALLKTEKSDKAQVAQRAETQNRSERASPSKNGYEVALSRESQSLKEAHQKAYEIAMNTPGVREDRVKALRERIKNGTYEIDSGKIADGMLREAIKDKLAMSE